MRALMVIAFALFAVPPLMCSHIDDALADPTYGVMLSPKYDPGTGLTETMLRNATLGSEVHFNITVTNIGTGINESNRDIIYLDIDAVPAGWYIYLDTPPDRGNDNPDYVRLASDEKATIVLHVDAPWEGWSGDMACFNVTANSSSDHTAVDTISACVMLVVPVDFELQFMKAAAQDPLDPYHGEKYDRIDPGGERQYIISIMNKGEINDSYSLSLSEPPSGSGWEWYFVDTGTRYYEIDLGCRTFEDIGARSGATISINVKCPADALAYEEGNITVTGWSHAMEDHGGNLTRSDDLKLVTSTILDFFVTLDKDKYYPGPNHTTVAKFTVHSLSNRDFKVRLSPEGVPIGWVIRFPEEDLLVSWNGSITVSISIIGHSRDMEGHYTILRFGVYLIGSSIYRDFNITIVNGWKGGFDLSVVQDFSEVLPGNGSGASLKIVSHYDGPVNVTVEVSQHPASWHVQLDNRQGARTYELGPWGEEWFPITVMVPDGVLMGEYRINVTAWSEQMLVNVSLPIRIGQAHGIDIGYYMGGPPFDPAWNPFAIPANATEQVWFFVENLGNGPERVNLVFGEERITGDLARWDIGIVSVGRVMEDRPDVPDDDGGDLNLSALPHGFEYSTLYHGRGHMIAFRDIWVVLGAHETAWVRVLLGAPGPEIMKLTARSPLVYLARTISGTIYRNVSLSVLYPDLEVGNVTILGPEGGPPVHDENATVGISVRNKGTCQAENVLVTVEVGGSVVAYGRIPTIGPGGSERIELLFIASRYLRRIEVEVDPGNEIVESADQFMENGTGDNNRFSTSFEVVERDDAKERSPLVLWSAIALTAVIAVVGAAQLLSMRSRRRRKAKERFVPE